MDFELPALAPSILAADYSRLGEQIGECTAAGCKWIHCDIMDGHFVPNISFGPALVKAVRGCTDAFLDIHLMIKQPDNFVEAFADAGADQITVHQEASPHLHRTIQSIHQRGLTAGVAVNPGTSLHTLEPVLNDIDLVLIMSVNPGFGGQSFIESTYERLQEIRRMRENSDTNFLIEVDGGVNLENIQKIASAGADVLVAGSAVFKAKNIPGRIEELTKRSKLGTGSWV